MVRAGRREDGLFSAFLLGLAPLLSSYLNVCASLSKKSKMQTVPSRIRKTKTKTKKETTTNLREAIARRLESPALSRLFSHAAGLYSTASVTD